LTELNEPGARDGGQLLLSHHKTFYSTNLPFLLLESLGNSTARGLPLSMRM